MNTTANPSELKPTDPRLKNRLNMRIFTTKDRFLGWLDDTMSTDIKKLAERQALLDSFDEILLVAIDAFNLAHDAEVVGAPKRTPDEIDALGMQVIEFSGLFQHYKDQMFSLFNSAASGKQSPNSSGSKDGHAPPGDSLMLNNDALHAFRKAREHLYKLLSKTPKQASIDKKWNYIPGTDFKGDNSYLKRIIEYRKYQNSRELVGLNINQQIYTALSNIPNYGFDSWRQDTTTDNTDDLDIIE